MKRVRVIVEGLTEETFINETLMPALAPRDVFVQPTVLGVPGHRGGRVSFSRLRKDILATLQQDREVICTTLLDFYGLQGDFPGMDAPNAQTAVERAEAMERALLEQVQREIGEYGLESRFVPYFQVFEFEGLLFSDPAVLALAMFRPDLRPALQAIRDAHISPEDINDGQMTAPSKRLLRLDPRYDKVISGNLAAAAMGIDRITQECPRFARWFDRLASLDR